MQLISLDFAYIIKYICHTLIYIQYLANTVNFSIFDSFEYELSSPCDDSINHITPVRTFLAQKSPSNKNIALLN